MLDSPNLLGLRASTSIARQILDAVTLPDYPDMAILARELLETTLDRSLALELMSEEQRKRFWEIKRSRESNQEEKP